MPELARGMAATLFERLAEQDGGAVPAFLLTEAAVRVSIGRELARLFNTRRPQACGLDAGLPPSVLDYGIPDFSAHHVANPDARDRLARDMENAITWFEPRLREPRVTVSVPRIAGSAMVVQVSGRAAIGNDIRRVEFDMDL